MTGTGTRAAAPAARYAFIDVLRGLAVLFMIETHTVNALLDPALRHGWFHHSLTFLNGLVAPAFLFCAGLGFSIFLSRRGDTVSGFGPGFRSYGRKVLFIVFLGYSLHIPVFSLRAMASADASVIAGLYQADILQVIGVSLLLLLAVAAILRTRPGRLAAAAVLTAATLAASVLFTGGGGAGVPVWLLAYVSRDVSPLFTLLPWTAFLTCGYLAGEGFVTSSAAGREGRYIKRVVFVSAGVVAVAVLASLFTFSLYPQGAYWHSGVEFFLIRLGAVLLLMAGLWRIAGTGGRGPASLLTLFGRESLPVYYFHLMIVYGKDFRLSYVRLFPAEMNYAECAGLTAALVLLMWGFAYGWNRLKARRPVAAAYALRGMIAFSAVMFLVS